MKIKLFISMMIAISLSSMAYSQTYKGNWIVSGNSSFQVLSSTPEGGDASTTVTLSPSIGYFVANNLAIGASVSLQSTEGTTIYSILPTASYYFETQSQIRPFVELGIGYASISADDENFGGLAVGAGAGIMYLFNQNVGLNVGLQYLRNDFDLGVINTFGGAMGFSIFF